jgi:Protein of unknown function (DUF2637)
MNAGVDRWIRWTTTGCVALLALIAGTVSYLHMHTLVELHGQPGWVAALTPLSVDGMIVAASTTLLADSRAGDQGGMLPWTLLVVGSAASLAANVAVAQPTAAGRVIAAWPSFALIGAYELLMRQVRRGAANGRPQHTKQASRTSKSQDGVEGKPPLRRPSSGAGPGKRQAVSESTAGDLQRQAWQWALAHRAADGSLPSGREIAHNYGRHERWGRLVKRAGTAGELAVPGLRLLEQPSQARGDDHSLNRQRTPRRFQIQGPNTAVRLRDPSQLFPLA